MKNTTGIRERIIAATTKEEVSQLLSELNSYKHASESTASRARKAAAQRIKQLEEVPAQPKKGNSK